MNQNDLNFIQEACIEKLNRLLQEIVDNDSIVTQLKKQPCEAKPEQKTTKKESK